MHVAVDDHSRHAPVSILADETADSVPQHILDKYQEYPSKGIVIKSDYISIPPNRYF